jgi:hypothetical protein
MDNPGSTGDWGTRPGCVVLPTVGSRGGTAIFWDKDLVQVESHALGQFSIIVSTWLLASSTAFWLSKFYCPTDDGMKDTFLAELAVAAPPLGQPCLLVGDFNIIYQARDKSNLNLNRRIRGRFRNAVDFSWLREIKCKNRRFTWSSEREQPTFCSIDKFLCNTDWEVLFLSYMLMAASTSCSDHFSLMLASAAAPHKHTHFHFESFWVKYLRFQEAVSLGTAR